MSHWRERPCSLAFCGHYAMQFIKCHTTAMSFSVLESMFPVWLQMLVPTSQATIHVFLCTASLRSLFGIGYRVLRCIKGWLAAVLGLHVAVQCRFTSLLLLWRFRFFFRVLRGLAHHNAHRCLLLHPARAGSRLHVP